MQKRKCKCESVMRGFVLTSGESEQWVGETGRTSRGTHNTTIDVDASGRVASRVQSLSHVDDLSD